MDPLEKNDSSASETMDTDSKDTGNMTMCQPSQALVNYSDSESDDWIIEDMLVSVCKSPLSVNDIVSHSDSDSDDLSNNDGFYSVMNPPLTSNDIVSDSDLEFFKDIDVLVWNTTPNASVKEERDSDLETSNASLDDISPVVNEIVLKNEPDDSCLEIGNSGKNDNSAAASVKNEPVCASYFENEDSELDDILVSTYHATAFYTTVSQELVVCKDGVYTGHAYTSPKVVHRSAVTDSEPEGGDLIVDDNLVRPANDLESETEVSNSNGVVVVPNDTLEKNSTPNSKDDDQDVDNSNALPAPNRQAKKKLIKSAVRKDLALRKLRARTRRPFSNKAVKRNESEGKSVKIVVPKMKSYGCKARITNTKPENRKIVNPKDVMRNFQCDQCNRFFSKSANLTRHIKDVHNGSVTLCVICGSKLSSLRGWQEHRRRFHNKKHEDLHCKYCGKAFTSQSGRSNHYRRGCDQDPSKNN